MGGSEILENGTGGAHTLVEVSGRNGTDSMYTVRWSDGHYSRYPFVWLLDNCRCPQCYQPTCYQRLVLMKDLDPEIKPTKEEITEDGTVKVTWSNNHVGEYPSSWLRQQQFDKGHYDPISDLKSRPWGSELEIPRFKYTDVLENDDELFRWLSALHEVGLAVLINAPTKKGVLEILGKRVAFLRPSNYGNTFQVHTKVNISSLAYTSVELGLHVDLPSYHFCPEVQMLHCLRQTKTAGGENEFSDAYNAVLILQKKHPEAYKLMKTVNISFRNCGNDDHVGEYHYTVSKPMIEEDSKGNFRQIYYNDHLRASYMNVPVDQVQDVYRAMKLFHKILHKHNINIKLRDGEIATFNNTRVMHGRAAFSADTSNSELVRHYEGGYLDWDEIHSRMRVLREKRDGELRV